VVKGLNLVARLAQRATRTRATSVSHRGALARARARDARSRKVQTAQSRSPVEGSRRSTSFDHICNSQSCPRTHACPRTHPCHGDLESFLERCRQVLLDSNSAIRIEDRTADDLLDIRVFSSPATSLIGTITWISASLTALAIARSLLAMSGASSVIILFRRLPFFLFILLHPRHSFSSFSFSGKTELAINDKRLWRDAREKRCFRNLALARFPEKRSRAMLIDYRSISVEIIDRILLLSYVFVPFFGNTAIIIHSSAAFETSLRHARGSCTNLDRSCLKKESDWPRQ